MKLEKYKLENTENEVNTIAVITKNVNYGCCNEATIVCSFLTLKEAQEMQSKLEKDNKTSDELFYDSFCVEMKSEIECEDPYWAVSTRCMGEINICTKCGKEL